MGLPLVAVHAIASCLPSPSFAQEFIVSAALVSPPSIQDIDEARLQQLLRRLPAWAVDATGWLRAPHRHPIRWLVAVALLVGGVLSFLPVLGLWMLPLGLALIADDVAIMRRWRGRCLAWLARKRPRWFEAERAAR